MAKADDPRLTMEELEAVLELAGCVNSASDKAWAFAAAHLPDPEMREESQLICEEVMALISPELQFLCTRSVLYMTRKRKLPASLCAQAMRESVAAMGPVEFRSETLPPED